jgi:hypothetical protein
MECQPCPGETEKGHTGCVGFSSSTDEKLEINAK